MPVDRREGALLGVLLLAVPVQYIISQWMSTTESQRSYAIKNLVDGAVEFKEEFLSWRSWKTWCARLIHNISPYSTTPFFEGQDDPNGESPAVEVINHLDPKGYFAGSPEPRTIRPPEVKYRIGQVVKHTTWGYRGVVIGWDEFAKAPENWLKHNHEKGKEHWKTQPNYAILVDTRDRLAPQITYVPQENLQVIVNVQILHPSIEDYFEKFDGAQYLPRPWLKAVYPKDN
ncbi:uncharacterized protein LOC127853546 [Dreissena polymorpha]|uniref:Hemimethylated DNA-binding domain-containing protein n=1 Tax=Dreissena polymorpha TaxID=45954 RepID=A0A9D4HSM4_DREPO|nr:uncharacterized protein LOC127853546 [Dreissena polymorpha]KAH3729491.1 hypothetical protein DPMN_055463 [Dreissena polymorpha]